MSLSLSRLSRRTATGRRPVRAPAAAVTLFARQLSTLLAAGLPLLRGLETLLRQERDPAFRLVIEDLRARVRGGATFSESLFANQRTFGDLLISMVRAGEAAGDLVAVLRRVAEFREKRARTRARLRAALIYPFIVVFVAMVIVGLLMFFVVPQFQEIFQGMLRGQPLPRLTSAVVGFSEWLRQDWPWLFVSGLAAGVLAAVSCHVPALRARFERLGYRAPVAGYPIQRAGIARFARTLGTLMRAGVPILEALTITRSVVGNAVLRDFIDVQSLRIRDGDSLAAGMQDHPAFNQMVASMMAVGEETGQLPELCDQIADHCEEELDAFVSTLIAAVEPAMIVLLALFVGTIVIALFLPIVAIIQHLGAS